MTAQNREAGFKKLKVLIVNRGAAIKQGLMELRGKDREIGMASSMGGYRGQAKGVREMLRDQAAAAGNNIHGDAILNLPQTLDHHQHHPHPYYHHNQFNPQLHLQPQTQQNLHNKERGPSNIAADPDTVSIANTATASTNQRVREAANRSNQGSPVAAMPTPTPTPPAAAQAQATPSTAIVTAPSISYKECLKNHAASMGSHVVDGCGEFVPSGEDGTPEALKCAACQCHRNFHRKETDGEPQSQHAANSFHTYNNPSSNVNHRNTINNRHHQSQQQPPNCHQHHRIVYTSPKSVSVAPMLMTFGGVGGCGGGSGGLEESSSEDLNMFHLSAAGQTLVQPKKKKKKKKKKRVRTKFTQEQKENMMEFAEKHEWRIQKQDDEAVQEFCAQVGVQRQAFKVWLHNNKQARSSKRKTE